MEQKPFLEDKPAEPQNLVVDELQKWAYRPGIILGGFAMIGQPWEMQMILDYTGLRGSASNIFWTFTHRVIKLRYTIRKADEWVEINPNYVDLYNQMLGQKQRIEGAIKSSLTSVAQAVADYELLRHDARRYGEILDYFKKGKTDQHVMRSLFVDRVDAFTGEGYSLVTMAKRWPTIITDFIRMKDEWEDVNAIRKELDVSQAEATVLKTKNELYKEWKKLFLPTIKERYARIQTLVKARQRSIDEYRNWLKPYIAKYKAMTEKTEGKEREFYVNNAFATPGFGTMDAWTFVRCWVFRPFTPAEFGKPESMIEKKGHGFVYDPYDDFTRHWKRRIEKHYGVQITDKEIREMLEKAIIRQEDSHCSVMDPQAVYYILLDMKIVLSTMKSPPPEGVEVDNMMFIPIKIWVMSHNALLVHLLELKAKEKHLQKYMDELIGTRSIEEEVYKKVEEELGEREAEKEKEEKESFWSKIKPKYYSKGDPRNAWTAEKDPYDFVPNRFMRFIRFFVKPGPYEPVFKERASKMYMRASGFYFKQMVDMLQQTMNIE
jgi:hypothetical protein